VSRHVVAAARDLAPGEHRLFTVKGRPIVVFNVAGAFYGLMNRCPHQGGSLCDGIVTGLVQSTRPGEYATIRQGEIIRCPWHGWEFDIRTGQSYCDPEKIRTKTYPVAIEPGTAVAKGPYVAETVPVQIEADYIVVDI